MNRWLLTVALQWQPRSAPASDGLTLKQQCRRKKRLNLKPLREMFKQLGQLTCDLCSATATSINSAQQHVFSRHVDGIKYECGKCPFTSKSVQNFFGVLHIVLYGVLLYSNDGLRLLKCAKLRYSDCL